MSLKPNRILLYLTGLLVFLLSETMSGRIVLASHHKAQIAFSSRRDGNLEIYVMDADGNNQIRLTNHPEKDLAPSWSPDGRRIAFVSNRNGGNHQIYVMDSNGKNVKRLTNGAWDGYPAWSPDGQWIAFHSSRDEESTKIYIVTPDGTNLQRLAGGIPSNDIEPAWSPGSQRIAFVSSREDEWNEIYVMEADGTNQKRLTHNTVSDRQPTWSPDGSKIVFFSVLEEDFIMSVMDSDGTDRKNLTEEVLDGLTQLIFNPAWSPDGRTIAYYSAMQGLNDGTIHLMTADGEHLKRLGKERDSWPDWFASASLAVSPASNQLTIWGKLKRLTTSLR